MTDTTSNTTSKTPWHLWLVGVLAVLFNAVGTFDYTMSKTQGAEYMTSGGMTAEQIAFIENYPMWMNVAWPTGVWTAFVASLLILLRRKAAFPLFVIAFAAFLTSLLYIYVLTSGGDILGLSVVAINAVITAELVFLIWYSRAMTKRGVLR